MLKIENLSYEYKSSDVKTLDGLSFELKGNELVAVIGKNGAGKSTLFKCIMGFLKDYKGSIYLSEKDIRSYSPIQLSHLVAYIPQRADFAFDYSVFDYVQMGTVNSLHYFEKPSNKQIEKVNNALDMLNISAYADKNIHNLSGGEQQLVLIARAIAQDARILIMDEPTSYLDYGNQHMVLNCALSLVQKGYTILFSTHNPEQAQKYATRVIALHDGKIISDGIPSENITSELLKELYNIEVY